MHDLVMRNLTQVEGMSLEVLREAVRWDFESVPQYLDMLERRGAVVNVAAFAGHSAIRTYDGRGCGAARLPARALAARFRAVVAARHENHRSEQELAPQPAQPCRHRPTCAVAA